MKSRLMALPIASVTKVPVSASVNATTEVASTAAVGVR
jgi:hypothetical protein